MTKQDKINDAIMLGIITVLSFAFLGVLLYFR